MNRRPYYSPPDDDPLAPARGIINGFVVGAAVWAIILGGFCLAVAL